MYNSDYFLQVLKGQVEQLDGDAIVNLILRSGDTYYVRDVVKTHQGYVILNVWLGINGLPIRAPSSDVYSQEVPHGYNQISVSFESISMIEIMPTTTEERKRIGYNLPNPIS